MWLGKELQMSIKLKTLVSLARSIGVTENTVRWWYRRDNIPKRHRKKVRQWLEEDSNNNMDLCNKLSNK